MRAWMFSSVRSSDRPAKVLASVPRKASKHGAMGSTSCFTPSRAAMSLASASEMSAV